MAKTLAILALVCMISLAGCSGKNDSTSNSSTSTSGSKSTTSTGAMNNTTTGNSSMEPIVLTGSVSGVEDCSLEARGQNAVSPVSVTLPAEASNRSYTLAFSGGQSPPAGFQGCIGFAGGAITGGLTGTIPDGATAAQIAVNLGQGRTYTLTIA